MKILLIGNSGSGKSCLIMRFTEQKFISSFYNTIGVDFKIKIIDHNSMKIKLQIWDTAGQDRFKNITSSYYRGAHGILVVYDITDRTSFEGIKLWMNEVEQFADQAVSVVLVGNKADLEERRQVSKQEGEHFANSMKITFMETSAREGQNVSEAFLELVNLILSKNKIKNLPEKPTKNQKLRASFQKQQSSCCS